jgi:site-specific DNA-adenine methylase
MIGGGSVSEDMKFKGKMYNQQIKENLVQFDNEINQNLQAINPDAAKKYQIIAK